MVGSFGVVVKGPGTALHDLRVSEKTVAECSHSDLVRWIKEASFVIEVFLRN